MDLVGKIAVVTGASRGIGAGIASEFLGRGMKVGLCARTRPETASAGRALSRSVDVTDYAAVEAFIQDVAAELGPVDLLVNNAGLLSPIGMARAVPPAEWGRLIDVNVKGVFHGMAAVLRHWEGAGRSGTIVNIGSGASTGAYEGWSAYCASKAAVDHLTRVVALEERARGHRIYCLAPGVIETDMQRLIRAADASDFPMVGRFREMKAAGQLKAPGSPAGAILDLAFGPRRQGDEVCLDIRDL